MNGDRRTEELPPVATTDPPPRIESNGTAPVIETAAQPTTSQAKPDQPGPGTLLIGMLFWAGLGLFWALKNDTAREFLGRWWWAVVIAFVLITTVVVYGGVKRWFVKAAA